MKKEGCCQDEACMLILKRLDTHVNVEHLTIRNARTGWMRSYSTIGHKSNSNPSKLSNHIPFVDGCMICWLCVCHLQKVLLCWLTIMQEMTMLSGHYADDNVVADRNQYIPVCFKSKLRHHVWVQIPLEQYMEVLDKKMETTRMDNGHVIILC
jgi:hypothetical protein